MKYRRCRNCRVPFRGLLFCSDCRRMGNWGLFIGGIIGGLVLKLFG